MTTYPTSAPRILVAEDDASHQRIIDIVLRRANYQATIVSNGLDALDAFLISEYDLVLIDLAMPGMDGFELLTRLKTQTANRDVRFFALTVYLAETMKARCEAAGFHAYLSKPLKVQTLLTALNASPSVSTEA